jgi:hypothetical protein
MLIPCLVSGLYVDPCMFEESPSYVGLESSLVIEGIRNEHVWLCKLSNALRNDIWWI